MDLLGNLRMLLLNCKFVMIYIIHNILVLLKNGLKYIKASIFECFFKEYNRYLFSVFSRPSFFKTYNDGKSKV